MALEEGEESVEHQPVNKTKGRVHGPKAHKEALELGDTTMRSRLGPPVLHVPGLG